MGSEQSAGDRIDFRISDRCSCRGRNCRAHTPVGGDKAENILQRGGYSEVCGRPVVRLSGRFAVPYVVSQAVKVMRKPWNCRACYVAVTCVFRKTQTLHDQFHAIEPALVPQEGN